MGENVATLGKGPDEIDTTRRKLAGGELTDPTVEAAEAIDHVAIAVTFEGIPGLHEAIAECVGSLIRSDEHSNAVHTSHSDGAEAFEGNPKYGDVALAKAVGSEIGDRTVPLLDVHFEVYHAEIDSIST